MFSFVRFLFSYTYCAYHGGAEVQYVKLLSILEDWNSIIYSEGEKVMQISEEQKLGSWTDIRGAKLLKVGEN
jgi:hypothetical protein